MYTRKLDPITMQRITALAATMPEPSQQCIRQLTGKQLIQMGLTEWNGEDVVPDRKYAVPMRVQTNNVRHLTRLFRRSGIDAVNAFVERALSQSSATETVFN